MLDVTRQPVEPIRNLPVDLIRPDRHQARRHFDEAALRELAGSIRESGVIQPVVVRPVGEGYELIAGERRWRATQIAGLHEIPAIVRSDLSEDECVVLGLIENLQRESLAPVDAAMGIQRLCGVARLTHAEVGERIGKSREYVTGFLRLLQLSQPVADLVNRGELSLAHGKLIATLPTSEQLGLAKEAIASRMTIRKLEKRVQARRPMRGFQVPPARRGGASEKSADQKRLEQRLSDILAFPVELNPEGAEKGTVKIRYASLEELSGLLERLGYRDE